MGMIKIENLYKSFHTRYGDVGAVRNLNLEVERGTFYTLLGPSGCGKTTTLRCVAGLETPEVGEIYIDDELVVSAEKKLFVPPEKRNIGMVFQSYAIWPHMDVFSNVAFPLTQGKKKISKNQIKEKVSWVLGLVRLYDLEKRPATQLSGGQQQRLALARALVNEPKLLLLDEPLSNLDAKLREEMRIEIKELVRKLSITTLYVTHDQLEALAMSDTITIMNNGEISQTGTSMDIYLRPKNRFVAGFIGASNMLEGIVEVCASTGNMGKVKTTAGTFECYLPENVNKSDKILILSRPEDIQLFYEGPPYDVNVAKGVVKSVLFLGDSIDCHVTVEGKSMRLKLKRTSTVAPGDRIFLHIPPECCAVILSE